MNTVDPFREIWFKMIADAKDKTKETKKEVLTVEDAADTMVTHSKCSRCIELEREVERLRSVVNDFQWERDARNGNIQGMN